MVRGDMSCDRRKADGVEVDQPVDRQQIVAMATDAGSGRIVSLWNGHEDDSNRRRTSLGPCREVHQDSDEEKANEANDLCFSHADVEDVYRDNRPLLANDPSWAA